MVHTTALYRRSPSTSLLQLFHARIPSTRGDFNNLFLTPNNRSKRNTFHAITSLPRDRPKKAVSRDYSSMTQSPESPQSDLFRYTSGRWLWDEEKQLSERYRKFDAQNLQRIAAECVRAEKCIKMKKIGEGSYNKVFRLVFDTGAVVIAKIPNPNAGPARYTTASEVATMEFVRIIDGPVYGASNWLTSNSI